MLKVSKLSFKKYEISSNELVSFYTNLLGVVSSRTESRAIKARLSKILNKSEEKSIMGIIASLFTSGSIYNRLSFMDAAIKDVLKKNKNKYGTPLIEFVRPDTNFNGYVGKIVNKYLNYYKSEDDKYDLVISAFEELFLTKNFKKAFNEFDGWIVLDDGKEQEVAIEPYLKTLFARAVISQSKKLSEDYSKRKHVNPMGDGADEESMEEAFDRVTFKESPKFSDAEEEVTYNQLLNALKKAMKQSKDYDTQIQVLNMLLDGYSKSEIANALNISNSRVSDRVWALQKAISEVAIKNKTLGDNDLITELADNFAKEGFPTLKKMFDEAGHKAPSRDYHSNPLRKKPAEVEVEE